MLHFLEKEPVRSYLGIPKTKEGEEISDAGTVFEEEAAEVDEIAVALLRKVAGNWSVLTHGFFNHLPVVALFHF